MTGKLDKFRVECGIHGAVVKTATHQLTPGCLADGEIDWQIDALHADLEACRREMKRRVQEQRKTSIFAERPDA